MGSGKNITTKTVLYIHIRTVCQMHLLDHIPVIKRENETYEVTC